MSLPSIHDVKLTAVGYHQPTSLHPVFHHQLVLSLTTTNQPVCTQYSTISWHSPSQLAQKEPARHSLDQVEVLEVEEEHHTISKYVGEVSHQTEGSQRVERAEVGEEAKWKQERPQIHQSYKTNTIIMSTTTTAATTTTTQNTTLIHTCNKLFSTHILPFHH